jgi:hypothetical protein
MHQEPAHLAAEKLDVAGVGSRQVEPRAGRLNGPQIADFGIDGDDV